MALGSDEQAIGIFRVDDDGGDLQGIAETEMLPCVAGVGGFVDAVSDGEIGTPQAFAAAYVNDVGIRGRDRERADGAGRLGIFRQIVEDWVPRMADVGGLPDSA